VSDAQAFYEALGNAVEGDALLTIDADDDAELVAALVRASDRVVDTGAKILVFLAGGGEIGVEAFTRRLVDAGSSAAVRSVVVAADEIGADAFDRLKSAAHP
jgi:hypothetical protein